MGRLLHEAVAVDPETHFAYMTEDNPNRCTLYRFIPDDPGGGAGSYERGGRLQAARVVGQDNADLRAPALGDEFRIEWIDLEKPDADPGEAPAEFTDISGNTSGPFLEAWSRGALRMSRGEGICHHGGKFYVVDTTAGLGPDGRRGWGEGAVWEYDPRAETLRAIFVAGSQIVGDNIDNITVNPRGGIVLCEDGEPVIDEYGPGTRLLGLTAAGESFALREERRPVDRQPGHRSRQESIARRLSRVGMVRGLLRSGGRSAVRQPAGARHHVCDLGALGEGESVANCQRHSAAAKIRFNASPRIPTSGPKIAVSVMPSAPLFMPKPKKT